MNGGPSFEDVFATMAAASVGQASARVSLPENPKVEDLPTRLALALNVLLDDLSVRIDSAERMAERLRILADASQEFAAATTDLAALLQAVARTLTGSVKDFCIVFLASPDGRELLPMAYDAPDDEMRRRVRDLYSEPLALDQGTLTGRVHQSGAPLLVPTLDLKQLRSQTKPKFSALAESIGMHSLLIVPLRVLGRPMGEVILARYRPKSPPFDQHDLSLASAIAVHASLAVANARAFEQLRESRTSEATFRGFVDTAPDALVITNAEGMVVLVSSQTEKLFGYARAELVGQRGNLLVPERFRGRYPVHRPGYFADPSARSMGPELELYGLRKDGSEFPIEVSLSPFQSRSGMLVSAAIRDISERKKAEEQRFRLAALVDASDDAIIGKTLQGIVTSWNAGAERLFGYSAAEMAGQPISRLVPADREGEETEILKHLAGGQVERFDTVRLRKDGDLVDVSVTSSPVRDSTGRLIGAVKVARDITERRRAEVRLGRAKEAAEAASRELEAFSYSVAHDLRAPLRGMNGFAVHLLEKYRDQLDARGQDWLREIVLNAGKMKELIDALLSLARLTRSELHRATVDLSALVREVARELAASEPGRAVETVVQDGLQAQADPALVRAVIENLFGNAWKFTSRSPAARIAFGAVAKNGAPAFFVRDNGAGFEMAQAGNLFTPFQRLHTAEDFAGTGIGLATVQRIVHRHGGRIWAEAAVNAGATFFFTFPAPLSEAAP